MCLIIACDKLRKLSVSKFKASLRSASAYNQDGVGIMYLENGRLKVEKSVGVYAKVMAKAVSLYEDTLTPFAIHFRYNTAGSNSLANTHPFKISATAAMMHNRTLSIDPPKKHWSDSRTVARLLELLCKANPDFLGSDLFYSFIEHQADEDNRFVFLDAQQEDFLIINEELGTWVDGVWFSNLYSWDCKRAGIKAPKRRYPLSQWSDDDFDDYKDPFAYRDDLPLAGGSSRMGSEFMDPAYGL
jgi:hypothetical protein